MIRLTVRIACDCAGSFASASPVARRGCKLGCVFPPRFFMVGKICLSKASIFFLPLAGILLSISPAMTKLG